ncbi:MAG TPA: POTRA domain-containing protein [Pseudorhodoferax sp.]|nr:POTRA domain-containing protein [Pseudorhodoferax sp.]
MNLRHSERLPSSLAALILGAALSAGVQAQGRPAGDPLDQLPVQTPAPGPAARPPQLEVQQPAGAAAAQADQAIHPSRFDIDGVRAIPFDAVAQLFAPWVGRPATVEQLTAIANEATALYRAQGYPLSFVYVPAQSFADGVVRVTAVEGFVAKVRIEGDAGPAEPKLLQIAQGMLGERPLRMATFERVSQLLTRIPGIALTADAALPGSTDGATDLVLKVRRQPYNVALSADLRQPKSRAILSGVLNDPFVPGGQLTASTALGDFQLDRLFTLGYTQLVGGDGLAIKASVVSYSGYPDKQNGPDSALVRHNDNRRAQLSASYPLTLSARGGATVEGGLYAVNNTDSYRVSQNGVTLNDETRIRALFAQLSWSDTTATRARVANLFVAQGLRVAGAAAYQTSNTPGVAGRSPTDLDFTRVSLDLSQRDRYAGGWGSAVSLGGQYSPNTLATSERVSFGGLRFGRGYAPGDGVGDAGWGAGLELNRQFPVDAGPWLQQLEPYVLLEGAQVRTELGTPSPRQLLSAALGVRLSDSRHYSVDLALAKPMGDAAPTNPERKLRASVLLVYQFDSL